MERGGGSPGCSGCAAGEDAPFRSRALAEKVAQHHLWHGDLLADAASFASFRAWLEERLPRVTQTSEGYFTAALAAVNSTTSEALAPDTCQYATCLWTRDVSNVSLALFLSGETAQATRAISALGALYSRADHAAVMDKMTAARGAGYDNFTCAPVRFECASGNRTDPWAHMQLDALGLFLTAYGTLAQAGHLAPDAGLIARFVRYLAAIEYWQRPDLGHWEEWPAVLRTSSIGCCVAGLRAVAPLLGDAARAELGVDALASRGAAALAARLGEGEGGAWEAEDRRDDAALLTLLLPPLAQQLQLTDAQREAVVTSALRLRRPHGVLRYTGDSYYGADYQARLRAWKREHAGGDPCAYPQPHVRNGWAVPGCEAQWTIFEPLLLLHFLWAHARAPRGSGSSGPGSRGGSAHGANAAAAAAAAAAAPQQPPPSPAAGDAAASAAEVRRSLMRILAAVEEEPAAGGTDVRLHVHESYAVVQGARGPNDVQDLLWAVAYIRMALAACADALADQDVAPFV